MSKEKNLTFGNHMEINGCSGPFVHADCHAFIQEPVYDDNPYTHKRTLLANRRVIAGPAIDRLHEFEKLGLEPEEIANLKNRLERKTEEYSTKIMEISRDFDDLQKECYDRTVALGEKELEIKECELALGELARCNTKLIAGKSKLKSENDMLSIAVDNQSSYIKELQKENEELKRQLKNLKESLAILAK